MVVGEPQILGQLKEAYRSAIAEGCVDNLLHRTCSRAFRTAKIVRTRTGIGQHSISVCFAARELAKEVFGDLSKRSVLILGAGEMGSLAAKYFSSDSVKTLYLASRSESKAMRLIRDCGANFIPYSQVNEVANRVDIIVGASAYTPEGGVHICAGDMARSSSDILLAVDVAVPRNLDEKLGELKNVFLLRHR